jgi:hypothetical protein
VSDSVNGVSPYVFGQAGAAQGYGSAMNQVMSSTSQLLGMSEQDLRTSLRSGQSLSDLAAQKGVSKDDLVSTVSSAISSSQSGVQGTQDPTALAQRIVDRKGGGHHHHHHKQTSDTDDQTSSAQSLGGLAGALGMSQSDLLQALQGGSSVFGLADQNGVPSDSLADYLGQGIAIDTTA